MADAIVTDVQFVDNAGNPVPVQTSTLPTPSLTDALVDAWFVETFHSVPDLRVEHFNRFAEAVDTLKARLRAQKG